MWKVAALLLVITIRSQATESLNLSDVVHNALSSSSLLQNQKTQLDLAERDRWRRFIFNEPQLQYTNADNNVNQAWGLQMAVGVPGKAFALSEGDDAKARAQRTELEAKRYDLVRQVSQAYIDCASAQATETLQKEVYSDLDTVSKSMKASYESGHGTQAEKIGSALQVRQAASDLQASMDKKVVTCRKLLRVMGRDPIHESIPDLTLPEDVDADILNELGDNTADQGRSTAAMDVAHANLNTAWWTQVPDLTLSVTRNHYLYLPGSPSGEPWTTTYGIGVTIPLFFPFYEGAEGKRTKAQSMIDIGNAEIQKLTADTDQSDASLEYQRSRKRLEELRKTDLVLAEALLDSTYSAYRSGKLGYAELVLARKTLVDLKTQDIQLRNSIVTAHLRCLKKCDPATAVKKEMP